MQMLNKLAMALVLGSLATGALAHSFDAKTPVLCSVYQLFECTPPNACEAVTPGAINGFSHFDIDFGGKVVTRSSGESKQQSPIQNVETGVDGKLIVQGIDEGLEGVRDGAGWSVSIMIPEGTMVLAVAGDGFAVVGLGGCVPKP